MKSMRSEVQVIDEKQKRVRKPLHINVQKIKRLTSVVKSSSAIVL